MSVGRSIWQNVVQWVGQHAPTVVLLGLGGFFYGGLIVFGNDPPVADSISDKVSPDEGEKRPSPRAETLRGRVVWLAEALERRWKVKTVPESVHRVLTLETKDGTLVPLLEDVRGRAFRADPRLRELKDCELLVRRYPGVPAVKIIHVFSHENGKKYVVDYWCDICAIAMFELKACDCCQGEIELRRRLVPSKR
jgi:hypothetical protein